MKCLSVRVIAPSLLLVSTVLSPVLVWSMSEMTDSQLATTTGQDGITLAIVPPPITTGINSDTTGYTTVDGRTLAALTQKNGLKIGAVVLHDKDGLGASSTYNKGGALILGDASMANSGNAVGVQMGLYGSTPIVVNIDATGNGAAVSVAAGGRPVDGSKPALNISIGLPSDLLIRTGDVSVSASKRNSVANPIAVGASGATKANAAIGGTVGTAYKILNSMDIALGAAVTINLQLGNTPQGSMISFGSLNIPSITFSGLSLVSPNGGVSPSQLTMTPVITDLNLTGLTVDVVKNVGTALGGTPANGFQTQGGLLFSDSSFTIGRVELNNVIAGNTSCGTPIPGPCISTNIAQGMANASMGSIGVSGITATNLRIGVSGM